MIQSSAIKRIAWHLSAVVIGGVLTMLASAPAQAQSTCPYIAYGAVLTAAQWQSCWQAKNDLLGFTPLNINGGTMLGPLITTPATALAAGFNVGVGVAPTSPNNGDLWATSAGLWTHVGGNTIELTGASASPIVGCVPAWSAVNPPTLGGGCQLTVSAVASSPAVTLNPLANSLQPGLIANQSPSGIYSGSGTALGITYFNGVIASNYDVVDSSCPPCTNIFGLAGSSLYVNGATTNTPNGTFAYIADVRLHSQNNNNSAYGSILARAIIDGNLNGSGSGNAIIAGVNENVGVAANVALGGSSAYVEGNECDMTINSGVTGLTNRYCFDIVLGQTDRVQGSVADAAISWRSAVNASAVGWHNLFLLDLTNSIILDSGGCIFCVTNPNSVSQTIATGIDLHLLAISGNAWESPCTSCGAVSAVALNGAGDFSARSGTFSYSVNGAAEVTVENNSATGSIATFHAVTHTTNSDIYFEVADQSGAPGLYMAGGSAVTAAYVQLNGSNIGTFTKGGGLQIGAPTGGDCGAGCLNAGALKVNNVPVLTANQTITLSGDTTGSGTTAITTTTGYVNGVAYGTSPSTNTVPVVTGTNAVTYEAVPNAALANSAVTLGGTGVSLGGAIGISGTPISSLYLSAPNLAGTVAGTPTIASAWTWSTAQTFPTTTTIGSGSGQAHGIINGGSSGSGAGGCLYVENAGAPNAVFGNKSACIGGSYNASLFLGGNAAIGFYGSGNALEGDWNITNSNAWTFSGQVNVTSLSIGGVPFSRTACVAFTPTDQSGASLTFTAVNFQYCQDDNIVYVYGTLTYPVTVSPANAEISLPSAVPNHTYANLCGNIVGNAAGTTWCAVPGTSYGSIVSGSGANVTNATLSTKQLFFQQWYPAS
jgi:hypothetical protein